MPIKLSDVKSKFTGKQTYSYRKVRWFTEMSNMSILWCIHSSVTIGMQTT